jgi:hypothetical protein
MQTILHELLGQVRQEIGLICTLCENINQNVLVNVFLHRLLEFSMDNRF